MPEEEKPLQEEGGNKPEDKVEQLIDNMWPLFSKMVCKQSILFVFILKPI